MFHIASFNYCHLRYVYLLGLGYGTRRINEDKSLTSTQGTKDEADVFWTHRWKRWPGEDTHFWNGNWREK